MGSSFQHEIPKARVNITLDVETAGATKKHELPLKLLVMGDYSKGNTERKIIERERINISRNNLESVLADFAPSLDYTVENKLKNDQPAINVSLKFDNYRSFHPEQVAQQVPELNNMLAMRNLLKDLKSNLLDNGMFRKELERILQSQPELKSLMGELTRLVDTNDQVVLPEKLNEEDEAGKA